MRDHDHNQHDHDQHGHEHPVQDRTGTRRRTARLTIAVLVAASALSGLRVVGTAERGVVRRFGRVIDDNVPSGLYIGLPWGIDRLTTVETRRTRRVAVGMDVTDRLLGALPDPARSQFLSGDRNIVDIQLSVQYSVSDPKAFLFATVDPEDCVRNACNVSLCETVAGMSVDDILTRRKAEIQIRVREGAQQILAAEGAGVQILSVSQERTAPPEKVADAFRAVTSARADRGRTIAEAQGYREDLLPRARGEAAAMLQQAQADAYALVADAQGRAERFETIRAQAEEAPDITRARLHAEMAEEVLGKTRPVIVSPGSTDDLRLIEERP